MNCKSFMFPVIDMSRKELEDAGVPAVSSKQTNNLPLPMLSFEPLF